MKKLFVLILVFFVSFNGYSAGLIDSQRISKNRNSNCKLNKKQGSELIGTTKSASTTERNFFEVLTIAVKNISVKIFCIVAGDFLNFSLKSTKNPKNSVNYLGVLKV